MFRLSCFHSPTNSLKPKKTVRLSTEAMQKYKPNKDPVFSKKVREGNNGDPFESYVGQDSRSEVLKTMNDTDNECDHEIKVMRKCVSLGTGLAAYPDMTCGEDSTSSHGHRRDDAYQNVRASVSQIGSNLVNHASDLSPDHLQRSNDQLVDNSETWLSGAHSGGSSSCTPCTPNDFVKSNSLPYLHLAHTNVVDNDTVETLLEQEIDSDGVGQSDKSDGYHDEVYDYVSFAKDSNVPPVDELGKGKSVQEDYSACQWEELPDDDFKIKRIEIWVMDLQLSSPFEETDMLADLDHHEQNAESTILDPMIAFEIDGKVIPGMDAAKRYISSLNAAATKAQLANHGLFVIPFLSAFLSLRDLNLSGNSIVRITVGVLPPGLHILNLSKNSISTIEGLRDLTRLRVLDLSYNRILRIGHGLASCASLKELYLAGNKISEVEGLHRLLKLKVLDLRFNKLSTTKNLGQLAANYNSLQAISLEGNPAEKNIGDEQLKKFLVGLLPHIAYFNRQSFKSGNMKDSSDRASRGLRSESKKTVRGRKSVVAGRGRHLRLQPSGVKAVGDRHQFADVSNQLVGFSPDLAMRRTHSEGLLKAA